MPILASKYHVVAPDLPGFGFTDMPEGFKFPFEALTGTLAELLDTISLLKFWIYIFDYSAPFGPSLALQRPTAIEAVIPQNRNAYAEGVGDV
jgi:pimeloyl-ACP methyl ester carboxylesterase